MKKILKENRLFITAIASLLVVMVGMTKIHHIEASTLVPIYLVMIWITWLASYIHCTKICGKRKEKFLCSLIMLIPVFPALVIFAACEVSKSRARNSDMIVGLICIGNAISSVILVGILPALINNLIH